MGFNKYEKQFYVYINTNIRNTVLYTGVTNNLLNRNSQHKEKNSKLSFTAKYNVDKLVYYEFFEDVSYAISREKQIKNLLRRKKIDLINTLNPKWKDLAEEL
jgi:putative endonuclease